MAYRSERKRTFYPNDQHSAAITSLSTTVSVTITFSVSFRLDPTTCKFQNSHSSQLLVASSRRLRLRHIAPTRCSAVTSHSATRAETTRPVHTIKHILSANEEDTKNQSLDETTQISLAAPRLFEKLEHTAVCPRVRSHCR